MDDTMEYPLSFPSDNQMSKWNRSQSGTALFSGAPRSFMSKAANPKKLVLQYSSYSTVDEIAVYKFSPQLQYDFKKMLEYCK